MEKLAIAKRTLGALAGLSFARKEIFGFKLELVLSIFSGSSLTRIENSILDFSLNSAS